MIRARTRKELERLLGSGKRKRLSTVETVTGIVPDKQETANKF